MGDSRADPVATDAHPAGSELLPGESDAVAFERESRVNATDSLGFRAAPDPFAAAAKAGSSRAVIFATDTHLDSAHAASIRPDPSPSEASADRVGNATDPIRLDTGTNRPAPSTVTPGRSSARPSPRSCRAGPSSVRHVADEMSFNADPVRPAPSAVRFVVGTVADVATTDRARVRLVSSKVDSASGHKDSVDGDENDARCHAERSEAAMT